MEKKDYSELLDGIRNLNMALVCLLRVSWTEYPEVRKFYYDIEKRYEELRLWVHEKEEEQRMKAEAGIED